AMADVVAQDLLFESAERGAHGGNLRHDVDAVAIVLDHAGEPAHLALDPAEPLETGGLGVALHVGYIPLPGIGVNRRPWITRIITPRTRMATSRRHPRPRTRCAA